MSSLVQQVSRSALAVTLTIGLNVSLPGCAHWPGRGNPGEAHGRVIDKNGQPYTKYPHLGRSHFQRVTPKSKGGR